MITILNTYSDIFKQAKIQGRETSRAYKFIEKKISEHRFSALKSVGYTRQWNNFQANWLENKLDDTMKGF